MKLFDAGTKKMSVSTFGSFIKLMKLPCTASWVSQRDREYFASQDLEDLFEANFQRNTLFIVLSLTPMT